MINSNNIQIQLTLLNSNGLKKVLFTFIFLYVCFNPLNAQNKFVYGNWYPGFQLDWGITSEVQVGINNYRVNSEKFAHGWAADLGYRFGNENKGMVAEVGYNAVFSSYVMFNGITNLNLKYYPWYNHQLILAPEIGIGFFFLYFTYQPNIPLNKNELEAFPIHQWRLGINLNLFNSLASNMRFIKKGFKNSYR